MFRTLYLVQILNVIALSWFQYSVACTLLSSLRLSLSLPALFSGSLIWQEGKRNKEEEVIRRVLSVWAKLRTSFWISSWRILGCWLSSV